MVTLETSSNFFSNFAITSPDSWRQKNKFINKKLHVSLHWLLKGGKNHINYPIRQSFLDGFIK